MSFPGRIAIRADATPAIGVGHIMRCLVLADELARCNISTTFLCREITDWAGAQVTRRGHDYILLAPEDRDEVADAAATRDVCETRGVSLIVVDHYGLRGIWCDAIAQAGFELVAIDDLAETARPAALLVDPGLGREAADYAALVPQTARRLTGADYALVRPEFVLERARERPPREGKSHLLISMGGSDPQGVSLTCLKALDGLPDVEVSVALTSGAPHLGALQRQIDGMQTPAALLIDHAEMPALVASADLVIGAGGSSALERCVLCVPTLLAVLADNQQTNANYLASVGAAEILQSFETAALRAQVTALLGNPDRLAHMAKAAARLCDGRGGARVAQAVVGVLTDHAAHLRPATPRDVALVFDWQTEKGARRYAHNPQPPLWQEHQAWFAQKMKTLGTDPFYIVEADDGPVGFVRLNQMAQDGVWEVSILIASAAQGRGIARTALTHLRLMHPKRHILARVLPHNTSSQALFQAAGYARLAQDTFASGGWDASTNLLRKDQAYAD